MGTRRTTAAVLCATAVVCSCGDQPTHRANTLTVLYPPPSDERVLGLPYDTEAKFLVFLPLTTENVHGELEGRLARSWEHSPDYRSWTVHLRSDVRWHDGTRVTAHDIKFTLDLMKHPDVLWADPNGYDVSVVDDTSYSITYRKPGGGNPLDTWTVYYPKHLLDRLDPAEFAGWEFWVRPVGNGPYRYVHHVPGAMVELAANPDYYRGRPTIDRVILKFGGQPFAELLSGSVDVVATEADVVKLAGDPRFHVYHSFGPANQAIVWNHHYPAFRDPRVRRALTLAIDRRELLSVLNLPAGAPVFDVLYTDDQFRGGELPPALTYDPREASQLLGDAGWRDTDGDGIVKHSGQPFTFIALVSGDRLQRAAVYVQLQLRRIGIRMEVQTLEVRALFARIRERDFDAVLAEMHLRGDRTSGSLNFEEDSPLGYTNPEVGSLLRRARESFDPAERDYSYRALWPAFQKDLPVTFLHRVMRTTIAHRRVRGLESPGRVDPVSHIEEVWLEREQ